MAIAADQPNSAVRTNPPETIRNLVSAGILFFGLLICYHLNGDVCPLDDPLTSMLQAESMVRNGRFSLSAPEAASLLEWRFISDGAEGRVRVMYFDDRLRELHAEGQLVAAPGMGYVQPTARPGVYITAFTPGAAITAVPIFACVDDSIQPLSQRPMRFWFAGKWVASLCVAASAIYVFATALTFVNRGWALLIAVAYGLGTCAWSTSSQALWQHGPNELFLAMGTFHLVRIDRSWWQPVLCGLAFSAATCCRPTGAVVVIAVAIYLAVYQRRALAPYLIAGLPLAVALASYNAHYFGSPLRFGQMAIANVAESKTGDQNIWQTPLWLGAAGSLISPSRGLFVFSPFLLFGVPGAWLAWRRPKYRALRPILAAVAAIWCIEFKHFDWWGGWSYGYRHLVDTMPLFILALVPIVPNLARSHALSGCFGVLLLWSIGVQFLGAFAYEFIGWNGRRAYRIEAPGEELRTTLDTAAAADAARLPGTRVTEIYLNIDEPAHRSRLWSIRDNQIGYYLTHFRATRTIRREITRLLSKAVPLTLSDTYVEIARIQIKHRQYPDAADSLGRAIAYNPRNRYAHEEWQHLCEARGEPAEALEWQKAAARLWGHPFQMFFGLTACTAEELSSAATQFRE